MEYASTVWLTYYAKNIAKVESVQRRMTRFIFNDYRPQCSVTSLLEKLQWPALCKRKECNKTIIILMFFKIIHNHVDIPCNHQFLSRTYQIPEETLSDSFSYNLILIAMLNPFFLSQLSYGIHYQTQLFLVKKLKDIINYYNCI